MSTATPALYSPAPASFLARLREIFSLGDQAADLKAAAYQAESWQGAEGGASDAGSLVEAIALPPDWQSTDWAEATEAFGRSGVLGLSLLPLSRR